MVEVLAAGTGEYRTPDPDGFREYVRAHKEAYAKSAQARAKLKAAEGRYSIERDNV